jgi:DNA polymerase-3 subunit alpha
MMKGCTKKLQIELHPKYVDENIIGFVEKNVKKFPGKSSLKFCLSEPSSKLKVSMYTLQNGFEMNDEMAKYLQQKPELEIQVELT